MALLVIDVKAGGEASRLGVRKLDLILEVDGLVASSSELFFRALAASGGNGLLKIQRGDEQYSVTFTSNKLGIEFREEDAVEVAHQAEARKLSEERESKDTRSLEDREWASKSIILTTTDNVPGRQISDVVSIVSSEASFVVEGTLLDRLYATDGRAASMASGVIETLKSRLLIEARRLRADAVVGLGFAIGAANKQVGVGVYVVIATGTAVTLIPKDDPGAKIEGRE